MGRHSHGSRDDKPYTKGFEMEPTYRIHWPKTKAQDYFLCRNGWIPHEPCCAKAWGDFALRGFEPE